MSANPQGTNLHLVPPSEIRTTSQLNVPFLIFQPEVEIEVDGTRGTGNPDLRLFWTRVYAATQSNQAIAANISTVEGLGVWRLRFARAANGQ